MSTILILIHCLKNKQSHLGIYALLKMDMVTYWTERLTSFHPLCCEPLHLGLMRFGLLKSLSVYYSRNVVN